MCYVLDLLIRVMTVGNSVCVCMYGLSVYFEVPVSFGDWYVARGNELNKQIIPPEESMTRVNGPVWMIEGIDGDRDVPSTLNE